MYFSVKSCGVIAVAYFGGLLLEFMNKQKVFMITSSFPLIVCMASYILPEKQNFNLQQQDTGERSNQHFRSMWLFLKQPQIYGPIVFIFLFMITPSANDAMFYYYTNFLGFKPEFMGRLKMIIGVANLVGIFLYNFILKDISFKKMIF